jgi:hypothetical protein
MLVKKFFIYSVLDTPFSPVLYSPYGGDVVNFFSITIARVAALYVPPKRQRRRRGRKNGR